MTNLDTARVAIIGAGVAGLSCAYRLQQAGISSIVLDSSPDIGGRTKMAGIGEEQVPLGAGIVYRGTESDALCEEFGIDRYPVVPTSFSVHYRGVTVVGETDGQLAAGLPISAEARADLLRVLARMRAEYGRLSTHGLTGASDVLMRQSFLDYLGDAHPEVVEFFESIVFAFAMTRADEISAKYALRYLMAKIMRDDGHSYYIPGGMYQLAAGLHTRLEQDVQLNTTVTEIVAGPSKYSVSWKGQQGPGATEVDHVVMAVPGPEVGELAPWLPSTKLEAISGIGSIASITMAVLVNPSPEASWKGAFMTGVVDGAFDYVVDPQIGSGLFGGQVPLQCGLWRERAEAQMNRPTAEIDAEWRAQLEAIYPGIGSAIVDTQVAKWPSCFAVPRADRLDVLDEVTKPVDRIHFAGDYASESAGTHGSIASGSRVAAEIVAELSPTTHP